MKLKELAHAEVPKLWAMRVSSWVEIRESTEEPKVVKSKLKGSYMMKDWTADYDPLTGAPSNVRLVDRKVPWEVPFVAYDGGRVLGTLKATTFSSLTGRALPSGMVCLIDVPEMREAIMKEVKIG